MKRLFSILLILFSLSSHAEKFYPGTGQTCWIAGETSGFCAAPATLGAGDTIVFTNQVYQTFAMVGFRGTVTDSIVIINQGGQATIGAMAFENCHYIKVVGDGHGGTFYGFKLQGTTIPNFSPGISVSGRSKAFNIGRVEIYDLWAGVMVKQDYGCVDSLNFPNWIISGVVIHDIRGRRCFGDFLYLGNTNPQGAAGCDPLQLSQPIKMSDFKVWNIDVADVARTGIQLGNCTNGEIWNCIVRNAGTEYNIFQGTGIIIGGSSTNVRVHHNIVASTFSPGISVLGYGVNHVDNNETDSSGMLYIPIEMDIDSLAKRLDTMINTGGHWGFSGNPIWNTSFYHITYSGRYLYNTYAQPAGITVQPDWNWFADGTHPANQGLASAESNPLDSIKVNIFDNNVGPSVNLDASYNYVHSTTSNRISLIDNDKVRYSYFNYVCNNTDENGSVAVTPSVEAGVNVFTAGCSLPSGIDPPTADAGADQPGVILSSAYLTGSGTAASGQTITLYNWQKISGPGSTSLPNPNNANVTASGLLSGLYTFRLTVTQTDGQTATNDMQVTVTLPAPPASNRTQFLIIK